MENTSVAMNKEPESIVDYLNQENIKNGLVKSLGDLSRTNDFVANVVSLYNASEALKDCDKKSIMLACLTATSIGLPLNQNLGYAYVLPFNVKEKFEENGKMLERYVKKAQFQIGYKGFKQLALRSRQFKRLNATNVREGEIANIDRLTGDIEFSWEQDLDKREKLKVVGYVAYMELKDGFSKTLYMTVKELEKHGLKYSQTYKKGFGLWKDEFDSMASKTVMKLLLSKDAPLTPEMQKAQLADQSIVKSDNDFEYVDNKVLTAVDVARDKENTKIMKHIAESKTIEDLEKCRDSLTTDEQKNAYMGKDLELSSI